MANDENQIVEVRSAGENEASLIFPGTVQKWSKGEVALGAFFVQRVEKIFRDSAEKGCQQIAQRLAKDFQYALKNKSQQEAHCVYGQ